MEAASHWLSVTVPRDASQEQKKSFWEWMLGEAKIYKKHLSTDRLCQPSYTTLDGEASDIIKVWFANPRHRNLLYDFWINAYGQGDQRDQQGGGQQAARKEPLYFGYWDNQAGKWTAMNFKVQVRKELSEDSRKRSKVLKALMRAISATSYIRDNYGSDAFLIPKWATNEIKVCRKKASRRRISPGRPSTTSRAK